MYELSVPLPFNIEYINQLIQYNKTYKNSNITSLYNSLPRGAVDITGFEQARTKDNNINDFDDMSKYIKYAIEHDFEFIYLLNKPIIQKKDCLDINFKPLNNLLDKLLTVGCKTLRVTNTFLIDYINRNFPDFNIYLSTSNEYNQIKQYNNLIQIFPNIKQIVPSWDMNKNFLLLKNIKKLYPNIDMELIANEGCPSGCPFRKEHLVIMSDRAENQMQQEEAFYNNTCHKFLESDFWLYVCKSNIIYPWEFKEYKEIGINKFKLVGRGDEDWFKSENFIKLYKFYMMALEDEKSIDDLPFIYLNQYIKRKNTLKNIIVKDVKKHLPNIKYFKKNGYRCSSVCNVECRYCNDCAEELSKNYKIDNN